MFHTKSEKRKQDSLIQETHLDLEKVEELAKFFNVSVKTEYMFVEFSIEPITTYVQKNNIDFLVTDSIPSSDIDIQDHNDMVNRIYKNI